MKIDSRLVTPSNPRSLSLRGSTPRPATSAETARLGRIGQNLNKNVSEWTIRSTDYLGTVNKYFYAII